MAAKKVARIVGLRPFPIATALLAALHRGSLRLVRGTKACEVHVDDVSVAVREGKTEGALKVSKKLKVRRNAGEAWALRYAKGLLVKGFEPDGFVIDPAALAAWRAQVGKLGQRSRGWEIESERSLLK